MFNVDGNLTIILLSCLCGLGLLIAVGIGVVVFLTSRKKKDQDDEEKTSSVPGPSKPVFPVDQVLCPACGAQNPAENHFCQYCGEKLDGSSFG